MSSWKVKAKYTPPKREDGVVTIYIGESAARTFVQFNRSSRSLSAMELAKEIEKALQEAPVATSAGCKGCDCRCASQDESCCSE